MIARGGDPVLYSRDGRVNCPEADRDCPAWIVESWYRAVCPDGFPGGQCPQARAIRFFYQIRPGSVLTDDLRDEERDFWRATDSDGNLLRSLPRNFNHNPVVFRVNRAEERVEELCPEGARMLRPKKGSGRFGNATCTCLKGWNPQIATVNGRQKLLRCDPPGEVSCRCGEVNGAATEFPERLLGYTEDGRMRCQVLEQHIFRADPGRIDDRGVADCMQDMTTEDCLPEFGAWVVNFDLGSCETQTNSPAKKGNVQNEIVCDNRRVTCGCFKDLPDDQGIIVRDSC